MERRRQAGARVSRRSCRAAGLALTLWAGVPAGSRADDFMLTAWGVDDGLPQNSVTSIAQTPDGYLWIGSLFGGVSLFDGVRFLPSDSNFLPELAHRSIGQLVTDSRGALWIHRFGPLYRWKAGNLAMELDDAPPAERLLYEGTGTLVFAAVDGRVLRGREKPDDTREWTVLDPPDRAMTQADLCADRTGAVWYRRRDGAVGRIDGNGGVVRVAVGPASAAVRSLAADSAGRIWAGTDRGLFEWDGAMFQPLADEEGGEPAGIRRIIPARDGSLWVEDAKRLRRFRQGRWLATVPDWDRLSGSREGDRPALGDSLGGLWIAAGPAGLFFVDADGSVRRFDTASGLPSPLVHCLFEDRQGNLWVGYARSGLVRIRRRLFKAVGKPEGLSDTVVTSVAEDGDGAIWMGTFSGSIETWAGGRSRHVRLPENPASYINSIVCPARDGTIWIATGGNGIWRGGRDGFHCAVPSSGPPDAATDPRLLLASRDGSLWFASLAGLYRLEGGRVSTVLQTEGDRRIAALAEDAAGVLWIGTFGAGLLSYRNGVFESRAPSDGVPDGWMWSFAEDPEGNLWIGTSKGGLLRYRDGRFFRFTTAQGLPADTVTRVLDDGEGYLWLGTPAGIARVSRDNLGLCERGRLSAVPCRVFDRNDGLRTVASSLEFQPACLKARDGRLWFAMANGAASVNPGDVKPNVRPPTVFIEEMRMDGRPLARPFRLPSEPMEIGPGRHDLVFRYTGLNMTAPDSVRFKIRLEGLDATWVDAGADRTAVYRYLAPGNYRFRVKARNSDGVWCDPGASVAFRVRPHVWETAWFRVSVPAAAVCLSGGLILLAARRRHRREIGAIERRRAVERERARIAQDLHDDLGAGLTEIHLASTLARDGALDDAERREIQREIGDRAREMAAALDEIVWAVNPGQDTVPSLAGYCGQYAERFFKPTPIRCRFEIAGDLPDVPMSAEERHNLFLVFKEALNNIVRHSGATEATVSIAVEGGRLALIVTDNGRGFEIPAAPCAGGNGLTNMRERLRRQGGECRVESGAGRGTSVRIELPVGAAAGRREGGEHDAHRAGGG